MSLIIESDFESTKIDRRILKTREALENSLISLLGTKGLQDISVAEIADSARINRATFYDHFQDKDDLFDFMIVKQYRQFIMQKLETAKPCEQPDFRNLIIGTYEFLRNHGGRCSSSHHLYKNTVEAKIQEQIYIIVSHWLKHERTDDLKSTAISWAIFGATNRLATLPNENKNRLKFIVNYIMGII